MPTNWTPPQQFDFSLPTEQPAGSASTPDWQAPQQFDFSEPEPEQQRSVYSFDTLIGQLKPITSRPSDSFNWFMGAAAKVGQTAGWLQGTGAELMSQSLKNLLPGEFGDTAVDTLYAPQKALAQKLEDRSAESASHWLDQVSDEFKTKASAGLDDPEFGLTTLYAAALGSMPEMMLTMGTGAVAGKLSRVAAEVGVGRIAAAAANGSAIASRMLQYSKYAPVVGGALAGGATEGLLAAGATGVAMEERVNAMTHEELLEGSDRYRSVYESAAGMDEAARREYAKRTVGEEMGRTTAAWVGLSTFALGAPTGGLMGYLGGRAAGRVGAGQAIQALERSAAGQAVTGFAAEGAQEFLQEGSQQFLQNLGLREYANKKQALSEGVLDAAVIGGLVGGVMGGSITPLVGADARKAARAEGKAADIEAGPEQDQFTYSRNPILEAKIVEQLKQVQGANVPPVEMQKVSRWAEGRSALEFSKALEQLIETGSAPENVEAVSGGDFDDNGLLTEQAYNKDASRLAFDVELRVKPNDEQRLAVATQLATNGANPYLLNDGTFVVPQSKQGEAGLRAVAESIQRLTGVPVQVKTREDSQAAEDLGTESTLAESAATAGTAEDQDLLTGDIEEIDYDILNNNASGESSASLEAIGRVREEKELGRMRMLIDRDGTVRPLIGVDAVDTFARPGQVIVQRGVGKDEWTAISNDPGMSQDIIAGKINAARGQLDEAVAEEEADAVQRRADGTVHITPEAGEAALDALGDRTALNPLNDIKEPTERQLVAGNYPKGHGILKGVASRENIPVSIENVPGSIRRAVGGGWSRKMKHYYGYIRGTKDVGDGKLDVYLGRNAHDNTLPVFVVRQMDTTTGAFDEPKVVMGYANEGEAKNAYLSEYPAHLHAKLFGGITRMTRAQFADYIETGDTDVPPNPITKKPMVELRGQKPSFSLKKGGRFDKYPGYSGKTSAPHYAQDNEKVGEEVVRYLFEHASYYGVKYDVRPGELLDLVDGSGVHWGRSGQAMRNRVINALKSLSREYKISADQLFNAMFPETPSFSLRLVSSRQGPLKGLPAKIKVDGKQVEFGPFQPARDAAAAYMRSAGMEYNPPTEYVKVVPERARMIAAYYHVMKHEPNNPEVKAAYDAMIAETKAQWEFIKATGLKVEFNPPGSDPYGNPRNAILDVVNNNHIFIFPTDEGFGSSDLDVSDNPLLADTGEKWGGKRVLVNDLFRVVHDYFGHVKEGVGFRADGEENAWRSHAAMYSPLARRAMTTETRGQNSWVNFGPYGTQNQVASPEETHYADQKIGLLPEWVSTDGATGDGKPKPLPPLAARPAAQQIADALIMAESRGNTEAVKLLRRIDAIRDKKIPNIPGDVVTRATRRKPTLMILPENDDGAPISAIVERDVLGFLSSRPEGTPGLMFSLRRKPTVETKGKRVERRTTPTRKRKPGLLSMKGAIASFAQGKIKPNAVSVIGVHYSDAPGLKSLDPSMAGSGSAGGERRRFGMGNYGKTAPSGSMMRRLYFYEQSGDTLPEKERAVSGEHAYRVRLDNIYDLSADPDGVIDTVIESYGQAAASNTDLIEETINDLGYDGFITSPMPGMKSRPIVLFGLTKNVPVSEVGGISASVTKTSAFKKWFGDSKVVDKDGNPMVVYHGTTGDFDAFNMPSYFTESVTEANAYSNYHPLRNRERELGRTSYVQESGEHLAGSRLPVYPIFSDAPVGEDVYTDEGIGYKDADGTVHIYSGIIDKKGSFEPGEMTIGISKGKGRDFFREHMIERREWIDRNWPADLGVGANVVPVYLSIKNPKYMSPQSANRFGARLGGTREDWDETVAKLEAEGYDGIVTESDDPGFFMSSEAQPQQWIPLRPEQIKSATGNIGAFDRSNASIIASLAKESPLNAPGSAADLMLTSGTYSALYHALQHERGVPKNATPKQWQEWLEGAQRRGLVRKEEIEFVNMEDFLDVDNPDPNLPQKISVTAMLQQVADQYPKIEETVLYEGDDDVFFDDASRDKAEDILREKIYQSGEFQWESPYYVNEIEEEDEEGNMVTRWAVFNSTYSSRVDRNSPVDDERFDDEDDALEYQFEYQAEEESEAQDQYIQDQIDRMDDDDWRELMREQGYEELLAPEGGAQYATWAAPDGENYRELLFNIDTSYTSPHFQDARKDEGLLMHVRVKDRWDAQQMILFIEEIQSDLHQEGRKRGVTTRAEHAAKRAEFQRIRDEAAEKSNQIEVEIQNLKDQRNAIFAKYSGVGDELVASMSDNDISAAEQLALKMRELRADQRAVMHAVPAFDDRFDENSPYITSPFRDSWQEVLMKQMIRYAAENNYKKIAWTTGMQQAERYQGGVSRAVDTIVYSGSTEESWIGGTYKGEKRFTYRAWQDLVTGEMLFEQGGVNRPMSELVGRQIAEAINANPFEKQSFDSRMVVGGKGMVLQYDSIMPKVAEKVGKRFGTKPERVNSLWMHRTTPGGQEAWVMPIPEDMREAMSKPMPAYSKSKGAGSDKLAQDVESIAKRISKNIKGAPEHTVVSNESGLPGYIQRQIESLGVAGEVEGMLDHASGRIFLIADNVELREGETLETAIERIYAEEVLGHYGLRATLGQSAMNSLFDQVWRDFRDTAEMREIVRQYGSTYGDPEIDRAVARQMADEFLAKTSPDTNPTLWQRAVAWLREVLRNMGFVREWTDSDLQVLMSRVFDSVRAGHVADSLVRLRESLVELDDDQNARVTTMDGRGMRTTTHYGEARRIEASNFVVDVIRGFEDREPAAELGSFAASRGGLRSLASFLSEEGARKLVAPAGMIPEKQLLSSGLSYYTSDGAVVIDLPEATVAKSSSFSLRNRKRGSQEIEDILAKTVQENVTDMSWGQRLNQGFRELVGYFGSGDTWAELKTGWVDSAQAIEKLERGQFDGKLLDASESAYKMVSLTKNLPQLMAAVAKAGVPTYRDGTFVRVQGRKGLYEIFSPLFKTADGQNLLHLWEGYAVARRSSQLINQTNPDGTSKEKLLSQDEIDKLLELEVQYPQFRKVFDEWQQFNRELLDLAVERGALDAEAANLWKQNDYVPFFRVEEDEDVAAGITRKRGLSGQRVTSKRLTGSDKRIQPVLENIMMNSASILEKVYKNEAMNRIVALADGIAMEREPLRAEAVKMSNEDIARALSKAGLFVGDNSNSTPEQKRASKLLRQNDIDYAVRAVEKMSQAQRDQWTTFFRRVRPEGRDVVSVMVAGKPVYYRVSDPLLLRAIMDMTPVNFGGLVDVMGGAKRLLTTMVTLDPAFMARNWMRDTLSSWVTVNEPFRPFRDAPSGAAEVWSEAGLAVDLAMAGGMTGGFYNPTQDFHGVMRDLSDPGITVLNTPQKLFNGYRRVGMVSEQVNRMAIAKAVIRRGGSIAEAAYQSQDVLNFSQSGDAVAAQLLIRTVPFLNARIQGLYRLWKGARGLDGRDPKKAAMAFFLKGLFLAGISMLLALKNRGDERYEKLPEYQKDTYWHFFVGDQHYAIPKPFEVGAMFATIPERAMRLLSGTDSGRATAQSLQRTLMDTFAFNPVPQLFKPIVEQWANRSFFTDRPIVGLELEGLEPQAQYNPYTSETARAAASAIDQVIPDSMQRFVPETLRSPTRLEHAMRAYLGTVGGYLLQLADAGLRQTGAFPEAPALASIRDVPVIGGVAGSFVRGEPELQGSSKYADDLYDALQRADDAYRTFNAYVNQGNLEAAQKLSERRLDALSVRPILHDFRETASQINTQQRLIMSSDLSPDEKRAALDELTRTKNRLMREAVPYLALMGY